MASGKSSGHPRQGLQAPVPPGVTLPEPGRGTQCHALAAKAVLDHRLDPMASQGFSSLINSVIDCVNLAQFTSGLSTPLLPTATSGADQPQSPHSHGKVLLAQPAPRQGGCEGTNHDKEGDIGGSQRLQRLRLLWGPPVVEGGASNVKAPGGIDGELPVDEIFTTLPSQSCHDRGGRSAQRNTFSQVLLTCRAQDRG